MSDSLGVEKSLESFADQCAQVIRDMGLQSIPSACFLAQNVVVSGMGGSALGGRIVSSLERQTLKIPIVVSTEFHLPNFVNEKTLVIVYSYSGNTEETLVSLKEAISRKAQVFVLTSGGKLADYAKKHGLANYVFTTENNPSDQPRMGLGYNILSIIALLARCQLIHPVWNLNKLPDFLRGRQDEARKTKRIAEAIWGKIPVLVASEHLKGAAHAIRNQINENSKTFACLFDLPEVNHHLLEGLAYPAENPQNLAFIFVTSNKYHGELKPRYLLTRRVVNKNRIFECELGVEGPDRLFEAMGLVQSGGYLAYYLAQLNGVDPGPIPWVDWYKDEIHKVV